jgi:hypothetical protein
MLTPQPAEASCSKDAAKCYLASMVNRPLELTKLVNHLPDTLVSDDECEGGWLQKKKKKGLTQISTGAVPSLMKYSRAVDIIRTRSHPLKVC